MSYMGRVSYNPLSSLPAKRKQAGHKAHLGVYKKMCKFSSVAYLLKFLSIGHPWPGKTKAKLFFEVSLGNRISDCVVLLTCGENRICYIIELKTCMSGNTNMFNEIRVCQRDQGLHQLSDAFKFICSNAPTGRQKWNLVPLLIFKSQGSLKTLYSETPYYTTNIIHTHFKKLSSFLYSRQDKKVLKTIHCDVQKKVAPKRGILGTKSTKQTSYKQKLINRNKKKCFQLQEMCSGTEKYKNKSMSTESRAGQLSPDSHEQNQRHS
ncbi:nuclear protein UL24 family [Vespertilionid gammaherpesvirus 1]|uniref:Nuclear protein UL24 family n=1 Tax=Vespertilionid gammaherpesvirus 1 TaxID=2560830 RepID=A0A0X9WYW3_9GAMA|nr:nuclear protein UL24 family [Myotis gammaherpesvirus 8]AMA67378.1 nuclear protein UL24 family [Vespertilionid gammaherpesvirus 1]